MHIFKMLKTKILPATVTVGECCYLYKKGYEFEVHDGKVRRIRKVRQEKFR